MPHGKVKVFDLVQFKRFNNHLHRNEWQLAVWMTVSPPVEGCDVITHFAPLGKSEFLRAVQSGGIGFECELAFVCREVREEMEHANPPKGYDKLPRRAVVTYPKIGGEFASEVAARQKAAKREARQRKLHG